MYVGGFFIFLDACRRADVDLVTGARVTGYANTASGARVRLADGRTDEAGLVIAADGLHSVARRLLSNDAPVNSSYVAYRAAIPIEKVNREVDLTQVSVHVGPRCHFVQYGLRGGGMLNQVAVFQSPKALAGEEDWGTPDELDAAFASACPEVRAGIPLMWRDRWWRMFDRDPIMTWVHGNIVLLGHAAHPPLQYMAQGAIMAIEDGWVLARHAVANRLQRNVLLRARDTYDYSYTDWIYGPTALTPDEIPPMYKTVPLNSVDIAAMT